MQVEKNISLKSYNTFGIEAFAKYFISFNTIENLNEAIDFKNKQQEHDIDIPILPLGGGSNILFTKNFDGIVLKNNLKGIELLKEDKDFNYIRAAAGENWHSLVTFCINNNYNGVENLSLIPGSVGASPIQNIGAYGVELKDIFFSLEAYHIQQRVIKTFNATACKFGYRDSVFKNELKGDFIILNVTFKLPKKPVYKTNYGAINIELERMGVKELSIQHISQAVINIRTSKLPNPTEIGNAGSFFKNPQVSKFKLHVIQEDYPEVVAYPVDDLNYKLAAGWLIEQCGFKGFRQGDVGCHAKQALVLVNYGKATGDAVLKLSDEIIGSVKDKFGVTLEREVNIV